MIITNPVRCSVMNPNSNVQIFRWRVAPHKIVAPLHASPALTHSHCCISALLSSPLVPDVSGREEVSEGNHTFATSSFYVSRRLLECLRGYIASTFLEICPVAGPYRWHTMEFSWSFRSLFDVSGFCCCVSIHGWLSSEVWWPCQD